MLKRCLFPTRGSAVACAFSGGPDSTALIALARHAGLDVTAHHVDHGLRPESVSDAEQARSIAAQVGVGFVLHQAIVAPGPNLEARARDARRGVLPNASMTGHTLDDQAETVLLRLLRGSGSDGLAAMRPGLTHPLLALRRHETHALCKTLEIEPVRDGSNDSPAMWRNRVRHELMPMATDIAARDVAPILSRTAALLGDDNALLDSLSEAIDPTDAATVAIADPALARRALRRWLTVDGYPPDAATVERVLLVARGDATGCEIGGGRRVQRSRQRLRITVIDQ